MTKKKVGSVANVLGMKANTSKSRAIQYKVIFIFNTLIIHEDDND